ncbi:helix-turn-helix transcriptional regulator [Candidatus Palauibacter sp.]|uniref:helix-turn-helix transcriptional regulator n=1 Tax=Candidatus Palauibacter sp. TaxID=3101350 RepID=UPI003B51E68C
METLERQFNSRVSGFLEETGMGATTLGLKAVGDPNLMREIAEGRSPSLRIADQVLAFINNHERDSGGARAPPRRRRRREPSPRTRRTKRTRVKSEQPMEQGTRAPIRFLRLPEVEARTGLARPTIYARMAAGTFPQSVSLGGRAVGWIESEVEAWMRNRIADTRSGAQGGARPNPNKERTE